MIALNLHKKSINMISGNLNDGKFHEQKIGQKYLDTNILEEDFWMIRLLDTWKIG